MNRASSATSIDSDPTTGRSMDRFLPVARKTLVIFLPLFLLVMGAIAVVYWSEINKHQHSVQENEKAGVILGKRIILDSLAPVLADLRYLSREVSSSDLLVAPKSGLARGNLETAFVNFSMAHRYYDQIRVIDASGMEIVRVNYNAGRPIAVTDDALQVKKHRYYFGEAMKLKKDQIYVSPLDLNIEHGAVEVPFKPMIRLAAAITGRDGGIMGVVIINFTARNLLDRFSQAAKQRDSQLMLLNREGYWLKGRSREEEWGFMFPQGREVTFGNRFPAVWRQIQSSEIGQLSTGQGTFTFCKVYPLLNCPEWLGCVSAADVADNARYTWIIVSHRPAMKILVERRPLLLKTLAASAVAFCILIMLSYRLAAVDLRRRQIEEALRQAREELEQTVAQRTAALGKTNKALRSQIEERKKIENALRKSEGQYRTLVETMREGICVIDARDRFSFVNGQFCTMLEYPPEEIVGHDCSEFLDPANLRKLNAERLKQGRGASAPFEMQWIKKSGAQAPTYVSPSALSEENGDSIGYFVVVSDITEQKQAESEREQLGLQLRQAQKMEAIGVLAGGIAHDFNNILMPIMGYAELIKSSLPEGDAIHGYIHPIMEASQRAKELVGQILSFSRQSNDERQPTQIAPLIREPLKLIKASLPSSIEIESRIEADGAMVLANPVQIHQLVMNLCTNAYQAMELTGGKLSVSLSEVQRPTFPREGSAVEARYACLTVSDNGVGIDPESLSRIFEPYFTTKEQGKGTGLGLSVVHGIVSAYNGEIRVNSRVGEGTTVSVSLPLIPAPSASASAAPPDQPEVGSETILLVDDEEAIVKLEQSMLERLGYTVTARIRSLDALAAFQADPRGYDLLITDLTMPDLNGLELAEKIIAIRQGFPVIMLTGFSAQLSPERLGKAGIRQIIRKPALVKDLAAAIRRALDDG